MFNVCISSLTHRLNNSVGKFLIIYADGCLLNRLDLFGLGQLNEIIMLTIGNQLVCDRVSLKVMFKVKCG